MPPLTKPTPTLTKPTTLRLRLKATNGQSITELDVSKLVCALSDRAVGLFGPDFELVAEKLK